MNQTHKQMGEGNALRRPTRNVTIDGRTLRYGKTFGHRMKVDTYLVCDFITIECDKPQMFIDVKDAKQIAKFILKFVEEHNAAKEVK